MDRLLDAKEVNEGVDAASQSSEPRNLASLAATIGDRKQIAVTLRKPPIPAMPNVAFGS
jgi:hypothetical protein